jgi:hypothetical protein
VRAGRWAPLDRTDLQDWSGTAACVDVKCFGMGAMNAQVLL